MQRKKNDTKATRNRRKKIEKSSFKFEKVLNAFIESSIFLLILLTMTIVITSLLFFVKVGISNFHLPIISIISIIAYLILRKNGIKKAIGAIMIGLLVFSVSTFAIGKIYDSTADGNTYHKLAVGALKNGWNPVYEDIADFNTDEGNPFDILKDNVNVKWVNHYANGTEQFAAVVYAFTGNIECGKVFNILWIYIGLFILCNLFKQMKITPLKSLLIACILALNPISVTQIVNLYLDGVLTISLFIIIIISIIKSLYETENTKENNLILAMAIIWCVNSKFTGLAFAAIFSFVLYLYRNIRNFIKDKELFKKNLIKETIYYIVVVFISVIIVGGSTYTKNLIQHGHPLYPLYGKGHVDNMVMMEMPESMQDYSPLRIFLISIFAKGENVSPSYAKTVNDPDLKVPFTFTMEEIKNYNIPDIRMGGFGPLFSGIFIITIIALIAVIIELIRKKEYEELLIYGILILTTITLVLTLDGSYWARYIPYVYLLPIYPLIYMMKKDYKNHQIINIVGVLIVIMFSINSLLILSTQYSNTKNNDEYVKIRIERLKKYYNENKKIKIKLNHHGLQGVQYNLDDLNIKNYELSEDENLINEGYMFNY